MYFPSCFCNSKFHYYKKDDSTLEQDFFVRTADELVPIEVKARNSKAKSLKRLVESDCYHDCKCYYKNVQKVENKNVHSKDMC